MPSGSSSPGVSTRSFVSVLTLAAALSAAPPAQAEFRSDLDGASLLYPWELKRLLRAAGLSAVALDFIVFFPRVLRAIRPLEPFLAWLPLGAQVCAWGTRR